MKWPVAVESASAFIDEKLKELGGRAIDFFEAIRFVSVLGRLSSGPPSLTIRPK
jgi:hypothetical protein